MTEFSKTSRRSFIQRTAGGAGALWTLSLENLMAKRAEGSAAGPNPYGPIAPVNDQTTGLPLLQLPKRFKYQSFSWTGDVMSDGVPCPALHDGMGVIEEIHSVNKDFDFDADERKGGKDDDRDDDKDDRGRTRHLILCRNHEPGGGAPYMNRPKLTYAADGAGGTTNLVFDAGRGQWLAAYATLAGTIRNCAGGVTPWGTWITCEETVDPGHGYNFEVDADKGDPTPLVDMGRFSHEAVMVDPRTGYVYQTEDSGDCGFYKFVPNRRGKLKRGGALYMMKVRREPNADLGMYHPVGTEWPVQWVRIADPRAISDSVFEQGFAKGGAKFRRLEGAWWGDRTGYFLSTSGGSVGEGQVFEYDPREEVVRLIYDSPNADTLDNPDNMTVTPRGGLLLCEDAAGNGFTQGERLIGLTTEGQTFTFAMNNVVLATPYNSRVPAGDYRQSEWAGACFSPDGKWLFVNIQTPGITFAITGPWGDGPL